MRINGEATVPSAFGQMYLTRHRLYSPVLRRFLSADPIGIYGGLNLYMYANGNPIAYIDPLGFCAESMTGSITDYLEASINQVVKGNYTDDVALLGTAGEVALGIAGFDLPMDIRDITYDLTNWEWSWSHAGQTALDVIAVIPIVGSLKYADEVDTLIKRSSDGFRRNPRNLAEQLSLEEVYGGAGYRIMENKALGDPRYIGMEKWQHVHTQPDGSKIVIHFIVDPQTGARTDFKFK